MIRPESPFSCSPLLAHTKELKQTVLLLQFSIFRYIQYNRGQLESNRGPLGPLPAKGNVPFDLVIPIAHGLSGVPHSEPDNTLWAIGCVKMCFSEAPESMGIVLLSVANSLTAGLIAAAFIGFSMGSEGDILPYLLGRYFGLKRLSTLYALTWTAYAVGGAIGPIDVGRVFDSVGSYRPIVIQILALPALIPCLLMFALPRYKCPRDRTQRIDEPARGIDSLSSRKGFEG
jgi:MFS family permease